MYLRANVCACMCTHMCVNTVTVGFTSSSQYEYLSSWAPKCGCFVKLPRPWAIWDWIKSCDIFSGDEHVRISDPWPHMTGVRFKKKSHTITRQTQPVPFTRDLLSIWTEGQLGDLLCKGWGQTEGWACWLTCFHLKILNKNKFRLTKQMTKPKLMSFADSDFCRPGSQDWNMVPQILRHVTKRSSRCIQMWDLKTVMIPGHKFLLPLWTYWKAWDRTTPLHHCQVEKGRLRMSRDVSGIPRTQ